MKSEKRRKKCNKIGERKLNSILYFGDLFYVILLTGEGYAISEVEMGFLT